MKFLLPKIAGRGALAGIVAAAVSACADAFPAEPLPPPAKAAKSQKPISARIRGIWLNALSSPAQVDAFVAKYPLCDGIHLVDGGDSVYNVIRYTGWNPSKTWSVDPEGNDAGMTYAALKSVIDRFHHHGWSVVLESATQLPPSLYFYKYINVLHRELAFVDGNGHRQGVTGSVGGDVGKGSPNPKLGRGGSGKGLLVPDPFAKFASPDPALGIQAGETLGDVYCARLKRMIEDGIEWDGSFGTDGWAGWGLQEDIYFLYPQQKLYGRTVGVSSLKSYYSWSQAEIDDWAASPHAVKLPEGWDAMTTTQKSSWVGENCPQQWFLHWQERFAKWMAQINKVFNDAGRPVGAIGNGDTSSWWTSGNMGASQLYDHAQLAEWRSFNSMWVDSEHTGAENYRLNALTAGLMKSKDPRLHVIAYASPSRWGRAVPLCDLKMNYLAQAMTFVWFDGERHQAIDPTQMILLADGGPLLSGELSATTNSFLEWAGLVSKYFSSPSLVPLYLGPTYLLSYYRDSGSIYPPTNFNYAFAQFADMRNLRNCPERIKPGMNALFFELSHDADGNPGIFQSVLDAFAGGSLNLYVHNPRMKPHSAIFNGEGEAACEAAFRTSAVSDGSSNVVAILGSDEISDAEARWIACGHYGESYRLDDGFHGKYLAEPGFIPIASFADGRIGFGICRSKSGGRLAYHADGRAKPAYPRDMLKRALYWATKSPLDISEPMIDVYAFSSGGDTLIPMLNHRALDDGWAERGFTFDDVKRAEPVPFTLGIDAARLGLGPIGGYSIRWLGDPSRESMSFSSWGELRLVLKDGADILLISPLEAKAARREKPEP